MPSLIETIRRGLTADRPPPAKFIQCESKLAAIVERDSLGALIASALASRQHGQMSDAILKITKSNRAQLDAIEGIMRALDDAFERRGNEVVFSKFRQIFPFEMGVENADDVIEMVRAFHQETDPDDVSQIVRLHELETKKLETTEALDFYRSRFQAGGAEAEIEDAESELKSVSKALENTKTAILNRVISIVSLLMGKRTTARPVSPRDYQISGWLYQIVTSTTLTKAATDVRVD